VYSGASIVVENALELERVFRRLLENEDELKRLSEIARNYVYGKAGASKKIVDFIYENRLLTN
jgi:3-deoxy-D-manno-octulosonic-acid transferase